MGGGERKAWITIVPELAEQLFSIGCKIGAYTLFPSKQIDRKMSINQARGTNPKIKDRFDLTLECIRLFYKGKANPLTDVFHRYENFFAVFEEISGNKHVVDIFRNDTMGTGNVKI